MSVCGSCSRGAHRDASTTPSVAGNKAKKKKREEVSWVRDALRFLGARSCFEGQSNGVKSPRVATRNVTRSHGNEPVAQAPRIFPPRILPHSSLFSFDFPRFPAEQVASFPTSRPFNIEIWLRLLVPMGYALRVHPTFCTFDMTNVNLRIAL